MFWIIYISGVIVAYIVLRKLNRYMANKYKWRYGYGDVAFGFILSLFSWFAAIVFGTIYIIDLLVEKNINNPKQRKDPPNWL